MQKLERGTVKSFNEDKKNGKLATLDKWGLETSEVLDFRYRTGQFADCEDGEMRFIGYTSFMQAMGLPRTGDELLFRRTADNKVAVWTDAALYRQREYEGTQPIYQLVFRIPAVDPGENVLWTGCGWAEIPGKYRLKFMDGEIDDPLKLEEHNGPGKETFFQVYVIDGPKGRSFPRLGAVLGRWVKCDEDPRLYPASLHAKAS